MVDLLAIFSEIKRLLVTGSTSRQDPTRPNISPSRAEPTSDLRDPHTLGNGTPLLPPPPSNTPAYASDSVHYELHIPFRYALGHSSSTIPSPLRPPAPTSWDPSFEIQGYSPSRSYHSITIDVPPPAYVSGGPPPTYSSSDGSAWPAWPTGGSRIAPVVGPSRSVSDPSQNQYPRHNLHGRAPLLHGRDMYRGTLFARVLPARRNLWLPAIVVGAVVGVYVLVKVGGKDKDANK